MYFPPADPATSENPSGDPDADLLFRIVEILREARRNRKYTLRDLSGKMGITYSFLSYAERGLSQPGLVVLMRWCRALDLDFIDVWKEASDLTQRGKSTPPS